MNFWHLWKNDKGREQSLEDNSWWDGLAGAAPRPRPQKVRVLSNWPQSPSSKSSNSTYAPADMAPWLLVCTSAVYITLRHQDNFEIMTG